MLLLKAISKQISGLNRTRAMLLSVTPVTTQGHVHITDWFCRLRHFDSQEPCYRTEAMSI